MGRNRKQRSILSFPPNSTPKTGLLSAIWAIIMPAFLRILSGLSSATTAPSFSIPMTPLLVNHSAICWTNKESSHYSFLFAPKLLISLPGRFGLFADWDSFWFCPLTPHCFVLLPSPLPAFLICFLPFSGPSEEMVRSCAQTSACHPRLSHLCRSLGGLSNLLLFFSIQSTPLVH